MKETYEAVTRFGKTRITKTVYSYDGLIDEAYKIEDIYDLGSGRVKVNTSYVNKSYADQMMGKSDFVRVK